jgi:hypothetical protein
LRKIEKRKDSGERGSFAALEVFAEVLNLFLGFVNAGIEVELGVLRLVFAAKEVFLFWHRTDYDRAFRLKAFTASSHTSEPESSTTKSREKPLEG